MPVVCPNRYAGSVDSTTIYVVGRKVWISAIHGLRCANHGSVLCATIRGLRAQSMNRAYLRVQSTNSWTIHGLRCVRKQMIAWFARRSSPRINYRSQV